LFETEELEQQEEFSENECLALPGNNVYRGNSNLPTKR